MRELSIALERAGEPCRFSFPLPPLPSLASSLSLSLSLVSSLANTDAGSYPVTCPRRHGKCRSNSSTSARLIGQVCRHDVRVPFPSLPSPSFPRLASKFHGTRAIRAAPPFDSSSTVARPYPRSRSFVGGCWPILLLLQTSKRRSRIRYENESGRTISGIHGRTSIFSKFLDNNSG